MLPLPPTGAAAGGADADAASEADEACNEEANELSAFSIRALLRDERRPPRAPLGSEFALGVSDEAEAPAPANGAGEDVEDGEEDEEGEVDATANADADAEEAEAEAEDDTMSGGSEGLVRVVSEGVSVSGAICICLKLCESRGTGLRLASSERPLV